MQNLLYIICCQVIHLVLCGCVCALGREQVPLHPHPSHKARKKGGIIAIGIYRLGSEQALNVPMCQLTFLILASLGLYKGYSWAICGDRHTSDWYLSVQIYYILIHRASGLVYQAAWMTFSYTELPGNYTHAAWNYKLLASLWYI